MWRLFALHLGLYSLSGKTSYWQISWSLEATRLDVIMVVSLSNLTGTSAAALLVCLLNFRAIGKVQTRISWLRDFTRSCSKTPYRLVNRGPVEMSWLLLRQWLWTKTSLSDLIFLSFLHKLWPAILDEVIAYIVIKICHCVTIKTYIVLFCERVNLTQKFSQLTCYPPAVLSAGFADDKDSLRRFSEPG